METDQACFSAPASCFKLPTAVHDFAFQERLAGDNNADGYLLRDPPLAATLRVQSSSGCFRSIPDTIRKGNRVVSLTHAPGYLV